MADIVSDKPRVRRLQKEVEAFQLSVNKKVSQARELVNSLRQEISEEQGK